MSARSADAAAAVVVPVGPDPAEEERLRDLVEAIRAFESEVALVFVDDAPAPREALATGYGATVVRTGVDVGAVDPYSAMVAGTLSALGAARGHDLIVKLDTDAVVAGPFVEALREALDRFPDAGVLGSYDVTCTGVSRDFSTWRRPIRRLARPVLIRRGPPFVEVVAPAAWRRRISVLRAARRHGYVAGEHCLGGAYAVRGRLVDELASRGWLTPAPWLGTWLGEDVVLGLLARACGYALRGLVGPGEPFGLARDGLPAPPDDLLANGHTILHSVKNDPRYSEAELRDHFRARR